MAQDLTIGKPSTVLWRFCLPMFGSIVFQQLYNIADSLVAGKFISENALAAVGNAYEVTLIFLAVSFGCNIGCSVITAQKFGAKQFEEMKTAVYTSLISAGILCLLIMGGGIGCLDLLLKLIKTPEDVFSDCKCYLEIYILSLPFVFYYNVATGIFSAMGDSKTPFYFLAASSIANIGMDILFVTAFQMGVAGVAWATLICQGISCLLALLLVLRKIRDIPSGKAPLFSLSALKRITIVAVPSMLQQGFISVGNIIIQGIINPYGSGIMAGYSAAVKLNNLVITSFTTIGNGISNYTAQNIGAGNTQRVRQGYGAGLKMVWLISIPLSILYFLGGHILIQFFLESTAGSAFETGITFLKILSPFYLIASTKLASDGVLRGSGKMEQFLVCTFSDLILRVVLAYLISSKIGSIGIWLAWPIGWIVGMILSVMFVFFTFYKCKSTQ